MKAGIPPSPPGKLSGLKVIEGARGEEKTEWGLAANPVCGQS